MNEEQPKETRLDRIIKEMQKKEIKENPEERIVHKLAEGISRNVPQPNETPTDLIMEQAEKNKLLIGKGPQQIQAASATPSSDKVDLPSMPVPVITIDGHEFRAWNHPQMDAVTVLMYLMVSLFADNKDVQRILGSINFEWKDKNGKKIYPAENKKPVKKRNARPAKR